MLTFFLDRTSDTPIYEQLYNEIKKAIENKLLKENDKLPSKRKLANHLKISQTTIESAYNQLLAEGYIKSRAKVGYFVAADLGFLYRYEQINQIDIKPKPKEVYAVDFKTNQVDSLNFPYDKLAKIERDIILDKLPNYINRGDNFGVYELRERISEVLFSYRGIKASPEQIIVASGSEHLLLLLVMLLGREKTFGVEDPSYIKNYLLYKSYGVKVKGITLGEEGLDVEELIKSSIDIIHTTPSHQFPKGIVTPIKRRLELLNWASKKENRYIIEDDYDSEFRFFGNPIPAMKGMDKFDKVIYLNSFSKTLSPSFRISFMVLPERLINLYHQDLDFFSSSVPTLNQLVLESFIKSGEYEIQLNRMKNIYKAKRDYLIELLESSKFKDKIEVFGEEAGLHFLIKVSTERSESYLINQAKEKSIRVYGLSEYYIQKHDKEEEKIIVIGYSNLSNSSLKEGVKNLEEAWENI